MAYGVYLQLTIRGIGKMLCMTDIEVPFIDFAVDSDHGNLDHDLKPRRRKMSIVKSEKQYTASDRTSGDANGISDVAAETTILIQRQECHHPQKQPSVTIGGHHYKNTGSGMYIVHVCQREEGEVGWKRWENRRREERKGRRRGEWGRRESGKESGNVGEGT